MGFVDWDGYVFESNDWHLDLNKIPKIERFNGNTTLYRGWKMQIENFLYSLNPKWVALLNMIEAYPTTISLRMPLQFLNLNLQDLRIIAGNLWGFFGMTLGDAYLPLLTAFAGGEERNGFEVWRRLFFYHGHSSTKQRVRGVKQLKNTRGWKGSSTSRNNY